MLAETASKAAPISTALMAAAKKVANYLSTPGCSRLMRWYTCRSRVVSELAAGL
jgi:hypothetical protein